LIEQLGQLGRQLGAAPLEPVGPIPDITDLIAAIIRRVDNDRWALPGGQVEVGERVAETVVREVREETGIEVEVLGLTGIYSDPKHVIAYDDGEVRQQFALSFRARPVGGSLRSSDEASEVRWLAIDDIDSLNIHPSMRLRIQHGLDASLAAPYIG
jgi:8-oxo-dGTP pyrophosphatase MutT (NUDIX family)